MSFPHREEVEFIILVILGLYGGNLGIMDRKRETTIVYFCPRRERLGATKLKCGNCTDRSRTGSNCLKLVVPWLPFYFPLSLYNPYIPFSIIPTKSIRLQSVSLPLESTLFALRVGLVDVHLQTML